MDNEIQSGNVYTTDKWRNEYRKWVIVFYSIVIALPIFYILTYLEYVQENPNGPQLYWEILLLVVTVLSVFISVVIFYPRMTRSKYQIVKIFEKTTRSKIIDTINNALKKENMKFEHIPNYKRKGVLSGRCLHFYLTNEGISIELNQYDFDGPVKGYYVIGIGYDENAKPQKICHIRDTMDSMFLQAQITHHGIS